MRSLLRSINRNGQTILHVTHDYEEAVSLASRVAVMDDGQIVQIGEPADVFRHPRSKFVASFIGIKNFFRGDLQHANGGGDLAEFLTDGPAFRVLTDAADGRGYLMVRSEDVIVSAARPDTSARNEFEGVVVDIAPARVGVEVVVDIGVEIASLVSAESVDRLALACGEKTWVSFKASAARFLKD